MGRTPGGHPIGSGAVRAATAWLDASGIVCPSSSNSTRSASSSCWTTSVRSAVVVSSAGVGSSVTGASVGRVATGVDSLISGMGVALGAISVDSTMTGSSVAGCTTGGSVGAGVASSARALNGKSSEAINEHKMTVEKTICFVVGFIDGTPSPPGYCNGLCPGRLLYGLCQCGGEDFAIIWPFSFVIRQHDATPGMEVTGNTTTSMVYWTIVS